MGDKRTKKRLVVFTILMAGLFILLGGLIQKDSEAAVQVLETNVTEAGEGKIMIGVQGTFYSTKENDMLDLMNEVRKEAYDEHIEYPRGSGKKLGIDYPYVPLKWSNSLENIARIRAAECSVRGAHSRPSGDSTFLPYNGFKSNGEVIAWNTEVLNAIRNKNDSDDGGSWYSEKKYYISDDYASYVTGHYTSMIDPDNKYVGISAFKGDYSTTSYGNYLSITGEFSSTSSELDQTFVGLDGHYIQKIEVLADYVTLNIAGDNVVYVDDDATFDLMATVKISSSNGSYNCPVYTPATWSIDDDSIAEINPATIRARNPTTINQPNKQPQIRLRTTTPQTQTGRPEKAKKTPPRKIHEIIILKACVTQSNSQHSVYCFPPFYTSSCILLQGEPIC